MKKYHLLNIILVTTGFILSPLSWWNDLVINVPLAYLISYPFSLLNESFFLPSFVLAYWFTNLLGLFMLHWGGEALITNNETSFSIRRSIIVSLIYTLLMILIVLFGWLASPTEYLKQPG